MQRMRSTLEEHSHRDILDTYPQVVSAAAWLLSPRMFCGTTYNELQAAGCILSSQARGPSQQNALYS